MTSQTKIPKKNSGTSRYDPLDRSYLDAMSFNWVHNCSATIPLHCMANNSLPRSTVFATNMERGNAPHRRVDIAVVGTAADTSCCVLWDLEEEVSSEKDDDDEDTRLYPRCTICSRRLAYELGGTHSPLTPLVAWGQCNA